MLIVTFKPFLNLKDGIQAKDFRAEKSFKKTDAGWSSLVARRAHNPKVASSNLAPATI